MPHIRTHDIQTHYLDEGTGEPVVLIHGHTLTHAMWDAQIEPLVGAGYRVIRYDLRGHGASGATETPNTSEELADDLAALLDALAVERTHVVGLSRGGGVALAFALGNAARTRSLTLIDALIPGRSYPGVLRPNTHGRTLREQGRAAFEQAWLAEELFAPSRRNSALAEQLATMVRAYNPAETAARNPSRLPELLIQDRLAEITAPTLVIVGELDTELFHRFADEMAASIPNARKVVVADAGHMSNMERPDVVNAELLSFLGSVSAGAAR